MLAQWERRGGVRGASVAAVAKTAARARAIDAVVLKAAGVGAFLLALVTTFWAVSDASEEAEAAGDTLALSEAWAMMMTGAGVALLGLIAYGLGVLVEAREP